MQVRLLGQLDVADVDRSIALGGAEQRAVWAILVLRENQVVPADRRIAPEDTRTRFTEPLTASAP